MEKKKKGAKTPARRKATVSKTVEVNDDGLGAPRIIGQSEIGDPGPIEKVTENDFVKAAKLEAFMNDVLTVLVHESQEEGALEYVVPQVNGVNQPIRRGVNSKVKRKYIEALARCRTTRYVQKVQDASKPENIQMVERTTMTYPFAILDDPSPIGRKWLESIKAQP